MACPKMRCHLITFWSLVQRTQKEMQGERRQCLLEPGWQTQRDIAIHYFLEPGAAYPESNAIKQLLKINECFRALAAYLESLSKNIHHYVLLRWAFGCFSN